jgi:exodeoxyribonuclease V beta subunit
VSIERSQLGLPVSWAGPPPSPRDLTSARFERRIDASWRRTSYTDIAGGVHDAVVASEPEPGDALLGDEPAASAVPAAAASTANLPLAAMPTGVEVGTLIHRVLEATDFAAVDLDGELAARITAVQARRRVEIGEPSAVVAGLRAAIETPLGELVGGMRLRDFTRTDRLDELEFELPLAGGEHPSGRLTLAAIAAVLRRTLTASDPLAGYAERLADPALRGAVAGYLTGSIDAVLRVREVDGSPDGAQPRFAIADYKTNWLGSPDRPLTASDYRPAALAAEMRRAHYGLQALLYTVALHRYLRWRLAAYDPERNLAGVLYLFVRGMTGPGATGGVFSWRPGKELVEALSAVLDAGARS